METVGNNATLDDILRTPFAQMLCNIVGEIILRHPSCEFSEDEKALYNVFRLFYSIQECLESIRCSVILSKRYDRTYLMKNKIDEEKYTSYHYDNVVHKFSTIKELEFKIVYAVNKLPKVDGKYCWKGINANRDKINNPCLFCYFDNLKYNNYKNSITSKRHQSSHDGTLSMASFQDVSCLIWLRDLNPKYNIATRGIEYANSYEVASQIKQSRRQANKKLDEIYHNSLNFSFIFFSAMHWDICKLFTESIRKNYGEIINKTLDEIAEGQDKCN